MATGEHWGVLTAVCTLMSAVSFVYDIPASLSTPLEVYLHLSDSKYAYLISALYTAYAAPNIVFPLLSGPLVQRLGEKYALLLTLVSVVTGQLLFALFVSIRNQPGMILGRVLFGLGAEIIGVLGAEITTCWFRDNCLSLALAINLASWRLGSVANSIIIPRLTQAHGVVAANWMGTGLSLGAGLLSSFYLVSILNSEQKHTTSEDVHGLICMLGYGGTETFTNSAQRFLAFTFYAGDQNAAGWAKSIPYFLSTVLIPPLGPLLNVPIFNYYPASLLISNLLLVSTHLLFLTRVDIGPIFPLCLMGTGFALFGVAFWAALTRCLLFVANSRSSQGKATMLSVSEQTYGTINSYGDDQNEGKSSVHHEEVIASGFGIMTSLMNLAIAAVGILLAGAENIAGYTGIEVVFLTCAFLGCLASTHLAWIWKGL